VSLQNCELRFLKLVKFRRKALVPRSAWRTGSSTTAFYKHSHVFPRWVFSKILSATSCPSDSRSHTICTLDEGKHGCSSIRNGQCVMIECLSVPTTETVVGDE
jgi:hypothetical protein